LSLVEEVSPLNEPTLNTTQLHQWVQRLQAGDLAAREQLLQKVGERLERLARKMLHKFPAVARWEQTNDVLQNALLRLLHSLERIQPETVRDFFNFAAVHIRRELLDLARRYARLANEEAGGAALAPVGGEDKLDPVDPETEPTDLDLWAEFHQAVENLPAEEREVMSLAFYHGWTQLEIADLFQVNERTVRRRWQSACLHLGEALQGRLPDLTEQ
jgi:RNA polymerase sigma-70 factor (ECF subfamily)